MKNVLVMKVKIKSKVKSPRLDSPLRGKRDVKGQEVDREESRQQSL